MLALTLLACGEERDACKCRPLYDGAVQPDGIVTREQDGGAESEAVCSIDAQVTLRAFGEKVVDCGNLPRLADPTARAAADRCVLDAQSTQRPFKLIVWMQGIDSHVAYAYISPGAGGKVARLEYDGFAPTGAGSVGMQTCSSLRAVAGCQASATTVCLECVDESAFSAACKEPAR